jgi:hypothetical protein
LQKSFTICYVNRFSKLSYMYFLYFCILHSWQTAIFWDQWDEHPPKHAQSHARDHWWTLDFANAFVFPGVNSRAELVPSPRAYVRNGADRWLEDRQQALTNLDTWSSVNNLKCNASKCKVLTVTRKTSPILHTYQLGSKELFMSDLFITNTKDRPCISHPRI